MLTLFLALVSVLHFSDVAAEVTPETLVVIDLDDTLIRYPSHLGSTAWFEAEWGRGDFHHLSGLLAQRLPVVPVEKEAPHLLVGLQESGIAVMGLTRRALHHPGCPNWPEKTAEQVTSIGITFNPPTCDGLTGGILITDGGKKGEALLHYLAALAEPPRHILFVDDRRGEAEEVEIALAPHYPITSVWYRYQELCGPRYDAEAADKELALLLRELEADISPEDEDPR
ncbi:MAG: DUF2608 domain-containing protein [Parachlamydiales bacterium]